MGDSFEPTIASVTDVQKDNAPTKTRIWICNLSQIMEWQRPLVAYWLGRSFQGHEIQYEWSRGCGFEPWLVEIWSAQFSLTSDLTPISPYVDTVTNRQMCMEKDIALTQLIRLKE